MSTFAACGTPYAASSAAAKRLSSAEQEKEHLIDARPDRSGSTDGLVAPHSVTLSHTTQGAKLVVRIVLRLQQAQPLDDTRPDPEPPPSPAPLAPRKPPSYAWRKLTAKQQADQDAYLACRRRSWLPINTVRSGIQPRPHTLPNLPIGR